MINDTELDIRVTDIMIRLGIPVSCLGFDYLRCSVILAYRRPDITQYVTKTLYPEVTRICRASNSSSVERTCRHAIEMACIGNYSREICSYLGCDPSHRPTCAQFINAIAAHIREYDSE